ncbi:LPS assembly lipoprotein LptE [Crenothrix sp.]|uniref:LPS-assembly lipoprotein LptE n=1 Tax=Crenothrix sp. TaxID=3100433 RepID=UPI00374D673B
MQKCAILIMALLLTACGYHLRGTFSLPAELKKVYLQGGSAPLRDQFNKTLEASAGQLVDSAEQAAVTVKVFDADIKQRGISLNAGGRSNEFELHYHLEYELRDATKKVLLPREPLDIRREYFNDQQDIIAKDNEEGVIRNEMYQQAVKNILNRMRAVLEAQPK